MSGESLDFHYGHRIGSRDSRGSEQTETPTSDIPRGIIVTFQRLSQDQASGSAIKTLPGLAPVSLGSNLVDFSPYFLIKGLKYFLPGSTPAENYIHTTFVLLPRRSFCCLHVSWVNCNTLWPVPEHILPFPPKLQASVCSRNLSLTFQKSPYPSLNACHPYSSIAQIIIQDLLCAAGTMGDDGGGTMKLDKVLLSWRVRSSGGDRKSKSKQYSKSNI